MKIIVNHLTRMQQDYICVAGINTSNYQHVRPVLNSRMPAELLDREGGPFGLASLIDLGPVRYCGSPPEVEDFSFKRENLRPEGIIPPAQFWQLLQNVAKRSIVELFGPAIKQVNLSCVVDAGTGNASLGCLLPAAAPRLSIINSSRNSYRDSSRKLRATITDGKFNPVLSVTDIRFYEEDHKTLKEDLIHQFNQQLQDGNPVILSIGLTRPFRPHDDSVSQHWLQVNNIHLQF